MRLLTLVYKLRCRLAKRGWKFKTWITTDYTVDGRRYFLVWEKGDVPVGKDPVTQAVVYLMVGTPPRGNWNENS